MNEVMTDVLVTRWEQVSDKIANLAEALPRRQT